MLVFPACIGICIGFSCFLWSFSFFGVDLLLSPILGQTLVMPRLSKTSCPSPSTILVQTGNTRVDGPSLPSLSSPRIQLSRRHPIIPGTVKLPPGLLCHPAVQSLPPRKAQSLTLVRRREQPGRRKDSIQSLYIAPGAELLFPSSPAAAADSGAQELQIPSNISRRFSNPDVAFVKDEVWVFKAGLSLDIGCGQWPMSH